MYALGPWVTAEGGFTATQRLMEELGIWKPRFAGRLTCIPGAVDKAQFGLAPAAYEALARDVGVIVHTGGSLRWTLDPDLVPQNINGLMNVVALARKNGASVHYLSSSSLTAEEYADEADRALFRNIPYFDVKRKARGPGQGGTRTCTEILSLAFASPSQHAEPPYSFLSFLTHGHYQQTHNHNIRTHVRRRTSCSSRRATTACAATSTACPSSPPTPAGTSARATPRHVEGRQACMHACNPPLILCALSMRFALPTD